jgi:hypothetical protein
MQTARNRIIAGKIPVFGIVRNIFNAAPIQTIDPVKVKILKRINLFLPTASSMLILFNISFLKISGIKMKLKHFVRVIQAYVT